MSVTPEDVRHVAELARLAIPADALPAYVEQLNDILAHMRVLHQAAGAAPTPRDSMALREDEPGSVPLAVPREQFAPLMRDGFFLVPRLPTHEHAGQDAGPST